MASYDIELLAGSGRELTLTIEASIGSAEPDVGIMSDYIDDWTVLGFAGYYGKQAVARFIRFLNNHPELSEAIDSKLNEFEIEPPDFDDCPYYLED
jgi:hypothetical protein